MKLGIMGFGILGKALKHVFEIKYPIYIYDKYQSEYSNIHDLSQNADIVFIAVPTPMNENGEIDLSHVEDALSNLSASINGQEKVVVLRSTIVPGTTDNFQSKFKNLKIVFNPEFLTEKNFLNDMRNTERAVLGSSFKDASKSVKEVYQEIFPDAKYILTDSKTAEMIKYASNVTLSSQIMVANEIYQICQKIGVNYETVKEALLLDKRIGSNITVPGPDGDLGFGGKCLPKDLNAIIKLSESKGHNPELLKQIWKSNLNLRKNKDWLSIKGATSKNSFKSI